MFTQIHLALSGNFLGLFQFNKLKSTHFEKQLDNLKQFLEDLLPSSKLNPLS
jgi:hypothetical protein